MLEKYQLLPDHTGDDYAALKADIKARGPQVPVEYDEAGNILDGHHRVKACMELGITDWPRVVRAGLTEEQKRVHVRQLNLARRHLNHAQKRDLIAAQLKDTPEKSNRQIAAGLQVDHKTVQAVRRDVEATGEIPQLSKTIGADGKARPKPKGPPPAKEPAVLRPPSGEEPAKARRGSLRMVPDPDFQAEAEAAARDIEIERDERIALAGAGELVAENERLTTLNRGLQQRINDLVGEVAQFKRKAKTWEKRARDAGWKPADV